MATTTNFGWDTPDDTDLVKDGAAAIRTLGNSIDTSFVDLKGGTTGQVLSKASNTDLDYTWTTVTADITEVNAGTGLSGGGTSGAVTLTNTMATAIDAKGDLVVGTGADTFSRLAVGATDGHTLQVDSTAATGMKWAAAPSPSYTWTAFTPVIKQGATLTLSSNSSRFITIGNLTVVEIKVTVSSSGTANNSIKWDNTSTSPNPPNPVEQDIPKGVAFIYDTSAGSSSWGTVDVTGNGFYPTSGIKNAGATYWGQTGAGFDQTLASGDKIGMIVTYRSA